MSQPRFSGHESFQCRFYWLKKGYDFIQQDGDFSSEDAPVKLGVGKNMVTAIRYWLKAFGVFDYEKKELSQLAYKIFDDEGWDPYLEDEGTLWLLHYYLVKSNYATAYHLIFNELRKKRPEFSSNHFTSWVEESGLTVSSNTLKTDFQIFNRTYVAKPESKDLDEGYSGLLTELGLVTSFQKEVEVNEKVVKSDWFSIESTKRSDIPAEVLLYCILEGLPDSSSIGFESLYSDGVGSIFALNRDGLAEKLMEIAEKYDWIIFSDEAGIKELQFSKKVDPIEILIGYYEN